MQVAPEEAAVINGTSTSEVFFCICSRQTQQILQKTNKSPSRSSSPKTCIYLKTVERRFLTVLEGMMSSSQSFSFFQHPLNTFKELRF